METFAGVMLPHFGKALSMASQVGSSLTKARGLYLQLASLPEYDAGSLYMMCASLLFPPQFAFVLGCRMKKDQVLETSGSMYF